MSKLKAILKLMRVQQWVKNGFILLPLVFSGHFTDINKVIANGFAFIGFSLLASSVYIFNDLRDVTDDRKHPIKKNRPLAAGTISVSLGVILAIILFLTGSLLTLALNSGLFLLLMGYVLLNIVYTISLKHIPVIDIIVLASFYIIRVFAGGIVTGVEISSWLLLTSFFIALFLGSGKRYVELVRSGSESRKVLLGYSEQFLLYVLTLASFSTILFYSLYTTTKSVYFEFSIVFIVLGFMFYFQELFSGKIKEDPVSVFIKNPKMLFLVAIWGAYMFLGLVFQL